MPLVFTLYVTGIALLDSSFHHDLAFFFGTFAKTLGRPLALSLAAFGIIHFYFLRRLRRDLQRHTAVLSGATRALLAQPQPATSASTLGGPTSVRTKLNWRWPLIISMPGLIICSGLLLKGAFGIRSMNADEVIGLRAFVLYLSCL